MLSKLLFATLLAVYITAYAEESATDNYKTYCVQCHGIQGNGKGINIRDMSVTPRDHTDVKSMSSRSDDELFKVIKEGGLSVSKSVLMPPWGATFTDEEIKDLVQHLRTLCKCKYGS
jgi:cytochrome c oxidase cbb3-type subunit 3